MARCPKHPRHKAKPHVSKAEAVGLLLFLFWTDCKLYNEIVQFNPRALKYLWHPPNSRSGGKKTASFNKMFCPKWLEKKATNVKWQSLSLQNTESSNRSWKTAWTWFPHRAGMLGRKGDLGWSEGRHTETVASVPRDGCLPPDDETPGTSHNKLGVRSVSK